MKISVKNAPKIIIVLYVIYVLMIALIAGGEYSFLVQPLIVPITILIGIFVWEWQEGLKNQEAKNQLYIKNYNEKAEKIFGIYTQYERSIQNLYRYFNDLHHTIKPKAFREIAKHKEISVLIEIIDEEVKLIKKFELDLYNEAVLLYYLVSNRKSLEGKGATDKNIYQQANDLINILTTYKYISNEIGQLIVNYKHSEKFPQDKDTDLIINFYILQPKIESFNFGNTEDRSEIIFVKPREKFIELTKQQ